MPVTAEHENEPAQPQRLPLWWQRRLPPHLQNPSTASPPLPKTLPPAPALPKMPKSPPPPYSLPAMPPPETPAQGAMPELAVPTSDPLEHSLLPSAPGKPAVMPLPTPSGAQPGQSHPPPVPLVDEEAGQSLLGQDPKFSIRWNNLIKQSPRLPMESLAREFGLDAMNPDDRRTLTLEWFRRATRECPELLNRGLASNIVTTWKDGLREAYAARGLLGLNEPELEAKALDMLYRTPAQNRPPMKSAAAPAILGLNAHVPIANTEPEPHGERASVNPNETKPMDAKGLADYYQQRSNVSLSRAALTLLDTPFRVVGGIAAGGNPVVQYEYQKRPFTPFNWAFKYSEPPKQEEALAWTNAQMAFNDALEAGLVARNSKTLGANVPVTIKLMPSKGNGTPGMVWVLEPGQKSPDKPSERYQLETPTTSDIETRQTWVPALGYLNPSTKGRNFVRYDAVDQKDYVVYDRKWNTTGKPKQIKDMERQIRSLIQNPEWTLVVEVPTKQAQEAALDSYWKAMKNFTNPEIANARIKVQIVEPGSAPSNRYDSMPVEMMPPPPVRPASTPPPGTPKMDRYRGR